MSTSKDNLCFLEGALKQWAKPHNGTVAIVRPGNLMDLFNALSTKPGGFRVGILSKSEEKRGELEEAPMFERRYWVCLSYGQPLRFEPGQVMTKGQAGGEAFADVIDQCVSFVRGLTFDPNTTEGNPNYLGWHELVEIHPGFMVDGVYLEFTIGCEPCDADAAAPVQGQGEEE